MTDIQSTVDAEALTLTFVTEFDAAPERVWQVWEDPRQLERWWGPPSWPATFTRHELVAGGESRYFMTGPEGEKAGGWWRTTATVAPHLIEFDDGFTDDSGEPNTDMPITRTVVSIDAIEGGRTRMTTVGTFENSEQLEQLMAMGMREGMTEALGQIAAILAG